MCEQNDELIQELVDCGSDFVKASVVAKRIAHVGPTMIPLLMKSAERRIINLEKVVVGVIRDGCEREDRDGYLSDIMEYAQPSNQLEVRHLALAVYALFPEHLRCMDQLLNLARDVREPTSLRTKAVEAILGRPLTSSDIQRVVTILEQKPMTAELFKRVVQVLSKSRVGKFRRNLQQLLEDYLQDSSLALRCSAIEALGQFADIDALERVCMLPWDSIGTNEKERLAEKKDLHSAVHSMVESMLNRPTNVLYLAPQNFEHLTKRLIEKLRFEDPVVQGGPSDGGVDVVCYRRSQEPIPLNDVTRREKVIIQCKRIRRGPVGVAEVEKLAKSKSDGQAVIALLIATCSFFKDAKELADRDKSITLYDREALQQRLDRYFGKGSYCIEP